MKNGMPMIRSCNPARLYAINRWFAGNRLNAYRSNTLVVMTHLFSHHAASKGMQS